MLKKTTNEIKHTAHSSYRCQYHIVFAPKYRRKEIYGKLKKDIGEILRKLCEQKGIEIIEAEACPDHIHMLVSVPPFWCRGYYVDTVGRNKKVIEQYIRNQLEEDLSSDQSSLKEYIDPFTGNKNM